MRAAESKALTCSPAFYRVSLLTCQSISEKAPGKEPDQGEASASLSNHD